MAMTGRQGHRGSRRGALVPGQRQRRNSRAARRGTSGGGWEQDQKKKKVSQSPMRFSSLSSTRQGRRPGGRASRTDGMHAQPEADVGEHMDGTFLQGCCAKLAGGAASSVRHTRAYGARLDVAPTHLRSPSPELAHDRLLNAEGVPIHRPVRLHDLRYVTASHRRSLELSSFALSSQRPGRVRHDLQVHGRAALLRPVRGRPAHVCHLARRCPCTRGGHEHGAVCRVLQLWDHPRRTNVEDQNCGGQTNKLQVTRKYTRLYTLPNNLAYVNYIN
jgi:hypothetical protein